MTSLELQDMTWQELNQNEFNSWHGMSKDNIDEYLVNPKLIEISASGGQTNNYWMVLDENPHDNANGYLVVYDEAEQMFGLATKCSGDVKGIGVLLGLYGSFVDALNNM